MKPLDVRLREAAKQNGILLDVIEKDYAQSYVLAGLMSQPSLKDTLVFKGGTALKKIFFGSYRFSEDLDFSTIHPPSREELEEIISQSTEETQRLLETYGRFIVEVKRLRETRPHPKGQDAFNIRVRFPWYGERVCSIKVEITRDEPVLLEPLVRPILHDYEEDLDVVIRCYRLEEIVAEKMRSLLQSRDRLAEGRWSRPLQKKSGASRISESHSHRYVGVIARGEIPDVEAMGLTVCREPDDFTDVDELPSLRVHPDIEGFPVRVDGANLHLSEAPKTIKYSFNARSR